MNHAPIRSGTILIIVAGISALMASLALAFLVRARADVEDAEITMRDAQARIMLAAACSYIMEASRIGWEPMKDNPSLPEGAQIPVSTEHNEAFGWIDVRDGGLGPRIETGGITDADRTSTTLENTDGNGVRYRVMDSKGNPRPIDKPMPANPPYDSRREGGQKFPIDVARRFPMHVLTRPPFAISPKVAENPVKLTAPDNGISYLRNPDPQPAVSSFDEWAKGDTIGKDANGKLVYRVRQDSIGKSWFRIRREKSGATFIVTCGAGGTLGYRTWAEVGAEQPLFNNEQAYFEALRTSEIRLWYRVEWDAAVSADEMNYLREQEEHSFKVSSMTYDGGGPDRYYSGQWYGPNMGGTIQMIQRLVKEPTNW